MFDNLKNLSSLMNQAGQLRERAEQFQAELERQRVDGEAGAGAVRVTMNGKFEVVAVKIDPAMVRTLAADPTQANEVDQQMVEELLAAAFNAAQQKAQALIREQMQKATGGLNLPGLENLLGG